MSDSQWVNMEQTDRNLIRDVYGRRGASFVVQALALTLKTTGEQFGLSQTEMETIYRDAQYQLKWACDSEARKVRDALYQTVKRSEGETRQD